MQAATQPVQGRVKDPPRRNPNRWSTERSQALNGAHIHYGSVWTRGNLFAKFSPATRRVAAYLHHLGYEVATTGRTRARRDTIARGCELTPAQVARALKDLRRYQLLETTRVRWRLYEHRLLWAEYKYVHGKEGEGQDPRVTLSREARVAIEAKPRRSPALARAFGRQRRSALIGPPLALIGPHRLDTRVKEYVVLPSEVLRRTAREAAAAADPEKKAAREQEGVLVPTAPVPTCNSTTPDPVPPPVAAPEAPVCPVAPVPPRPPVLAAPPAKGGPGGGGGGPGVPPEDPRAGVQWAGVPRRTGYRAPDPGHGGVPAYPSRVPVATAPRAPLLPAEGSPDLWVTWLVQAYQGALRDAKGKEPYIPPPVVHRARAGLVATARLLVEMGIAPAEWALWSVGIWGHYAAKARGKGSRPPLHWVWSEVRVRTREGWFGHDGAAQLGGRLILSDALRDLLARHARMRTQLLDARGPADVAAIVARWFPPGEYDRLVEAARAHAVETEETLRREVARGRWIW